MMALIPGGTTQFEAAADDGVQKTFGFAGPRTSGNERGVAAVDGSDGLFLVPVDVRNFSRNTLPHMRVKDALCDQITDGSTLFEGTRDTDEGAFQEG